MDRPLRLLEEAFLKFPEARREAPGFAALPDAVLAVFLDFWWEGGELIRAVERLPVEEVPLGELQWALDVPFGRSPRGPYTLTMRQVIETPDLYPEVWRRVTNGDLRCPIALAQTRGGRWVIADGFHRLSRAYLECAGSISAVRLLPETIPAVLRRDGFYGELNRLRDFVPNLMPDARAAARSFLQSGSARFAPDPDHR